MATQERTYQETRETLLSLVNDMAELHKGVFTLSDTEHGCIGYRVEMYGAHYEYLFEVSELPKGCLVKISSANGQGDEAKRLRELFILLESMLYA